MAKPKVIIQIYPMMPAADEADRMARAPIGRDRDLYHEVLHDWTDLVKLADDLGVWGVSTIEHHLHSEGYEVGPNPGVLNAYWASIVKNAHIGALGYVMATQDPIRVAEESFASILVPPVESARSEPDRRPTAVGLRQSGSTSRPSDRFLRPRRCKWPAGGLPETGRRTSNR